jgi:hypothetical protein
MALVGKPEGRRPPARHTRRWEYNIKTALRQVEWKRGGGHKLNRSGSGYGQLAGSCEYCDELSVYKNRAEFLG